MRLPAPEMSPDEYAIWERFEMAPPAPESWAMRSPLLRFMDVAGWTPFFERVAIWLAARLPGGIR